MKLLRAALDLVDHLNDWIGRIVSYGVFFMFVLVLIEVIRRYFFNSPTVWGNELTQLIFGSYVILSGGYILKHGGHVNVDIFYSKLSNKRKAIVDIITFIIFFLFIGILFLYGGSFALESLMTYEHSQSAWNPPIYPFKLMIPLSALLLLLQGSAKLIRDIYFLATGKNFKTDDIAESAERESL